MYHIFIVYSSTDAYLGLFHFLIIVTRAAVNVKVQVSLL